MQKIKKLLMLGAFAVLALTACGGDNGGPSVSTGGNGGTTEPITGTNDIQKDENGSVIYNNVEIKVWSVTTGPDAQTQDEIIAKFNEMYEGMIHVTIDQHISRYDLEQMLTSTIEFNPELAPDILFSHGARAAEYVDRGWLLPQDHWIEEAGLVVDDADYVESLLDSVQLDGKLYGLPQDVHSSMVVVRKDILEKNNLKIPTNYAELVEVCEAATRLASEGNLWIRGQNSEDILRTEWRKARTSETYYPFPLSYGDMWVHEFLGYTIPVQNGVTIVDEEGMPAFNTDEMVKGLEVLRGIVSPTSTSLNSLPLSLNYGSDYDVGNAPFSAGNAIFKLQGPWEHPNNIKEFDTYYELDGGSDNITVIPCSNLFALDNTKDYASKIKGEGHAFMMMKTVDSHTKRCAAMVFADWMVQNAGIDWAKRGHLPSLKSVEQSSDYRTAPEYEQYIKNLGSCEDYVVFPSTKYYSIIDAGFKSAVERSMLERYLSTPVKDIVEEAYYNTMDDIELWS